MSSEEKTAMLMDDFLQDVIDSAVILECALNLLEEDGSPKRKVERVGYLLSLYLTELGKHVTGYRGQLEGINPRLTC